MTDEVKRRLLDALMACQAITDFTAGLDFASYEASLLIRSAVERQFEIIGEAMHRAEDEDPALIERLPELRQIVGLRNRIIHGYDVVDDELVWKAAQHNIPALQERLVIFLSRNNDDAPPD